VAVGVPVSWRLELTVPDRPSHCARHSLFGYQNQHRKTIWHIAFTENRMLTLLAVLQFDRAGVG
jgi:hypothetical protein